MKLIFRSIPFVICFIVFLLKTNVAYAASSIYLSPGSRTVYQGVNFTVAVRMNSGGDSINAVQANLAYPADKLDFVGISKGGSAFNIDAPSSGGGGGVSINRGVIGTGVSGDKLIASVTFRPKTSSGAATISVSGDSALLRGSDQANVLGARSGGTYTLAVASEAPSPSPEAASNISSLTISDLKVTNLSFNTATIEWKTNREASSIVDFGLSSLYGFSAQNDTLSTTHSVDLNSDFLSPGVTYHYRVKSIDRNKQEAVGNDQTFVTDGISLVLEVTNEQGNILAGKEITLVTPQGPIKATTDNAGKAKFEDLTAITYTVLVQQNGSSSGNIVSIKAPTDDDLKKGIVEQVASIRVARASKYGYLPYIGALIAAFLGIFIIVIRFKYRKNLEKLYFYQKPRS